MGVPNSWMVFVKFCQGQCHRRKWMMTGGTPMNRETSICFRLGTVPQQCQGCLSAPSLVPPCYTLFLTHLIIVIQSSYWSDQFINPFSYPWDTALQGLMVHGQLMISRWFGYCGLTQSFSKCADVQHIIWLYLVGGLEHEFYFSIYNNPEKYPYNSLQLMIS